MNRHHLTHSVSRVNDKMYKKVTNYSFNQIVGHTPDSLFSWLNGEQVKLASYFRDQLEIITLERCGEDEMKGYRIVESRSTKLTNTSCNIIYARVISVFDHQLLIFITDRDVQFHDLQSNQVLHTFIPDGQFISSSVKQTYSFAFGLTHFRISQVTNSIYIAIGCESCGILLFSVSESSTKQLRVAYDMMIQVSRDSTAAITQLNSKEQTVIGATVACGDTGGNLITWTPDAHQRLARKSTFTSFNRFPVTAITLTHFYLIASYGSGHIRVYSLATERLVSHVRAHYGWINCMKSVECAVDDTVHVISASDDSRLRFWQISDKQPQLTHKGDHVVKNTLLVGVTFVQDHVFAVGYDSALITTFTRL